ncbi:MAG TPA: hypothetical protein VID27_16080 [Blastocatellia bacterium]
MRLGILTVLVIAFVTVASSVFSATSGRELSQNKPDPISGEWKGSFELQSGGDSFAITLKMKLNGDRVTGTSDSDHGGAGTITGSWKSGELNIAIETDHGTLALTGALKDGRLFGDWDAGHAQGRWEARKK